MSATSTLQLNKKARYVDHDKCNACLACTEKCPGKSVSEWDEGLAKKKAISIPLPAGSTPKNRLLTKMPVSIS